MLCSKWKWCNRYQLLNKYWLAHTSQGQFPAFYVTLCLYYMPGSYNWLIKNTLLYFSTTLTQLLFLFSQHLFVRDELKQLSRSRVPSNICVFGGTRLAWFGAHAKSRPKAWSSHEVLLWQLAQKSCRSSLILHKRRKLCSVFEELASGLGCFFFSVGYFMVATYSTLSPGFCVVCYHIISLWR